MDDEHKYKGVSTVTGSDKFRAQIWDPFKKEIVHLGSPYDTKEEAAKVYNDYAMILFDDKAYTNPLPRDKDFGKREALSARDYAKSIRQGDAGVESKSSEEIEDEIVERKKRTKKYSPLHGVSYSRARGMWTASFDREGIYWIDFFKTEKEASDARDKKLIETFGMNKVKHILNNVGQYYTSAHDPFPGRKTKERKIVQSPSSVISKVSKREVVSKEPIRYSKYSYGVTYIGNGMWQSSIIVPGEGWQQLGVHTTDRAAAEAYNEAAKPHGLPLNDIDEEVTDIEMESIKRIVEEPEISDPRIDIGEAKSGGLEDLSRYDRNVDGTVGDPYKYVDGTVKRRDDEEGGAGVVSR